MFALSGLLSRKSLAALTSNNVAVGWTYLNGFVTEAVRGIRSSLVDRRKATLVTAESTREFFEARSSLGFVNGGSDVIAVSSTPYLSLLGAPSIRNILRTIPTDGVVIDYGCGSGNLLRYLHANGYSVQYVGYDLDRIAIDHAKAKSANESAQFRHVDEIICPYDLAILVNVLVYNQEAPAINLLRMIRAGARESAQILIIEPYPKWYWEFAFDGIRLCPRDPSELEVLLEATGWLPDELTGVSLFLMGGRSIFPIAYALSGRTKR